VSPNNASCTALATYKNKAMHMNDFLAAPSQTTPPIVREEETEMRQIHADEKEQD